MSSAITYLASPDEPTPAVHVTADRVIIEHLVANDPDVVAGARSSGDPVAAIRKQLAVGARMIRLGETSLDAEALRSEVDLLTDRVTGAVDQAVHRLGDVAASLLDEKTGTLVVRERQLMADLRAVLASTFDGAAPDSAVMGLQRAVGRTNEQHLRDMQALIDPDAPTSMLGRFRADLARALDDQLGSVRTELRSLTERVATQAAASVATRAEYDRGTAKGVDYEKYVLRLVEQSALVHGDLAAYTAREPGATGALHGDITVTINPADTAGLSAAVVLEVKTGKVSMVKIMAELNSALTNRDAAAAVAVFASQHAAPIEAPFIWFDNKAILVLDPADPDLDAVQLAYAWARWIARRELSAAEGLDVVRIQSLLDEAHRALRRKTNVKRVLGAARSKITEASTEVDNLAADVGAAIAALGDELRGLRVDADPDQTA